MNNLSAVDLAIVAFYVVGTTVLGAAFSRRQTSTTAYFVGDRNVSWWLVLISIVATETSTVTFLGIPALSYDPGNPAINKPPGNLTFLQLAFGYIIGRVAIAWFLLPQYFDGKMLSAYQLLRQRFSPAVQRTASGLFLVTRTLVDGLRLCLTSYLVSQLTGFDVKVSILMLGAVTLVYTYLGGMEAVIWTDLVQFVIYIAGALVAGFFILKMLPGGWTEFVAIQGSAGRFQWFDPEFAWTKEHTIWAGLIGGAFVTMASHGADQNMVQRYFCARTLGSARTALVLSGLVVTLQFLLFLLIGLGLSALVQKGLMVVPPGTRNDAVFGQFIIHYLPTGLIGLVVAAVLASAMASFSSSLNSAANAFVSDFYRPLRPNHSEAFYLKLSKAMTSFWGIAKISVALLCIEMLQNRSVVAQVLGIASVTTGLILGLFFLGSASKPVSSKAAIAGICVGFVLSGGFWFAWVSGNSILAWPWYAPVGALTTVVVGLLVDKLGVRNGSSHN